MNDCPLPIGLIDWDRAFIAWLANHRVVVVATVSKSPVCPAWQHVSLCEEEDAALPSRRRLWVTWITWRPHPGNCNEASLTNLRDRSTLGLRPISAHWSLNRCTLLLPISARRPLNRCTLLLPISARRPLNRCTLVRPTRTGIGNNSALKCAEVDIWPFLYMYFLWH